MQPVKDCPKSTWKNDPIVPLSPFVRIVLNQGLAYSFKLEVEIIFKSFFCIMKTKDMVC